MMAGLFWLVLAALSSALGDWSRTYDGTGYDKFDAVLKTLDGNYLLAGTHYGPSDFDVWAYKISPTGDSIWSYQYGGSGRDYIYDAVQLSSGSFVLVGKTTSFGFGGYDYLIVKISPTGSLLGMVAYGGTSDDYAKSVVETPDGCVLVVGSSISFGAGSGDVWLLKADTTTLDTVWTRTYGGSFYEEGYDIKRAPGGGYVICGVKFSASDGDAWLLKVDDWGLLVWQHTFGGTGNDRAACVVPTADGGYALAGQTESYGAGDYDVYLIKTDGSGNLLWQRTYGGAGRDFADCIVSTADGGFFILGSTSSFGSDVQGYMIRTDPSGDTIWTATFGGPYDDDFHDGLVTDGGCYLGVGHWGVDSGLDKDGYVVEFCADTGTTTPCPPPDPTTAVAIPGTICVGESAVLVASSDVVFGSGGSNLCNQPVDIDRGCSRSMSLLKWSEMPPGFSGGTIVGIGVYVTSPGPSPSPVNIRMKTVAESSISCGNHDGYCQCGPSDCCADWDETGTLVYSGPVDYSTTGWTMITLTTPFSWTGDNLLITWDWCYTGSGWACVRGTPATGELFHTQFYDYCSDDADREDQYCWDGSDWNCCCTNNYLVDSWARVDYKLVFGGLLRALSVPMSDSTYFVWFEGFCGDDLAAAVDTGETISVAPATTTTYFVRNYNPYYDCWSDTCLSVTVYVDNLSAHITPADTSICAGESFVLNGNPSGGFGGYIHQWTGDTSPLSSTTVQSPTFSTTTPGTYVLTYTVVDGAGCSASDTVFVTVYPLPVATASNSGPYCEGDTIELFGGPPGMESYLWYGPGGFTSSEQNPVIPGATVAQSGTYTLVVVDTNGCSDTAYTDVSVRVCTCPPAVVWVECPYPCWSYSSCGDQVVIFGVHDTTGVEIDTNRVWVTSIVFHPDLTADTVHLCEPTPLMEFSSLSDSVTVTVRGSFSDGDSVIITLDSLYNIDGCLTIP